MKLIWFVVLSNILFLAERADNRLLSAEPSPRDVWHVYVDHGTNFGFVHTIVIKQPDGNYKFTVESQLLLDVLGQQSKITTREHYVVDSDLRPISICKTTRQASGQIELIGRVEGNILLLERNAYGVTRKRKIELSKNAIFRVCVPDWLKTRPNEELKTFVRVIDDETLNADLARFQRQESADGSRTWLANLNMGAIPGRGRIILDQKGFLQQEIFDVPKIGLRLSTEEQAGKITHRRLNNRFMLIFPIDKNITHPNDLKSLTVKLSWKGIPLKEFHLEDERQRLVSHKEKNGQHEAVVNIGPISNPESAEKPTLKDSQLKTYVAETLYIKPNNTNISQQARRWTKGAGSKIEAVRMLSKGVFDHLNGGTLIPETLSGPEVLQCRNGKCSEFSTLFASLARSLGIPTRIVLGDRMISGRWIGHMWTEVYVGRWITADTTTNEVGNAPALLKFVHGDSVGETQSLRWALTESLDISIADFKMNSSKSALTLKTGVKGNTYTNADFRCRVTAAAANWKIVDKSKPGQVLIRFQIPDHKDVQIHFVAYSLPLAFDAKAMIGLRHGRFTGMYKEYKMLRKKEQNLDDRKWQTLQFTRDPLKNEQGRMKTTEYIWHEGSSGFLINIIAKESDHDRLEKDFLKIVKSFKYLEQQPKEIPKPR